MAGMKYLHVVAGDHSPCDGDPHWAENGRTNRAFGRRERQRTTGAVAFLEGDARPRGAARRPGEGRAWRGKKPIRDGFGQAGAARRLSPPARQNWSRQKWRYGPIGQTLEGRPKANSTQPPANRCLRALPQAGSISWSTLVLDRPDRDGPAGAKTICGFLARPSIHETKFRPEASRGFRWT